MKNIIFILTIFLFGLRANAQTRKDGTPDLRFKTNKQTYSNTYFASRQRTRSVRPIYSGQTHTTSHGGAYPGSVNSHHKGGHYLSPAYSKNYGIHKTTNR